MTGDPAIRRDSFDALVAEGMAVDVEAFWGAGFLAGRYLEAASRWTYSDILRPYLDRATVVLDMGTGEGGVLRALRPLPRRTVAYEAWLPTVPAAVVTLRPIGVPLVVCRAAPANTYPASSHDVGLPFVDGAFDLVINRHESFDPREIVRLLRPGGWFVTQQVGTDDERSLCELLGLQPDGAVWDLRTARSLVEASGLEVVAADEDRGHNQFNDVGALLAYVRTVPWAVPELDLDHLRPRLLALHEECNRTGSVSTIRTRFWLAARR